AKFDQGIKDYSEQANVIKAKAKELNLRLGELMKKQKEISGVKVKLRNLEEKFRLKQELLQQMDSLKEKVGEINVKKVELNKKLSAFGDVSEEYTKLKKELDLLLEDEKKIEIEKNSLEQEKRGLKNYLAEVEKEILAKLEIKKKLTYISEMQNWIEDGFVNIMIAMEKQVMFSVYNEFNELFENWFNILIGDETLSARLDDNFTPVIEQDGYETSIEYLSGGERTAAALAYRLALNKVVNDLM
ncbi:unnamed protein product, partial [marine sediment metagenome]